MKNILVATLLLSCFSSIGQMTLKYKKAELSVDYHVDSMITNSDDYKGRRIVLRSQLLEFTQQIIDLEDIHFEKSFSKEALRIVDVDFDGYQDVIVLLGSVYSPANYDFFIFNPRTEAFEQYDKSREYSNISFDSISQTIYHNWRIGVSEVGHGLLSWNHGRLIQVAEETLMFPPSHEESFPSYKSLKWIVNGEKKYLVYEVDSLFSDDQFLGFNSDRSRLERLVNISESVSESKRKELRDSITSNIDSSSYGRYFTGDELLDINYDGELDLIIETYGKPGSGEAGGMLVYPFSKTDNNYIFNSELSKIKNPKIDLENKSIVGYYLSDSGGTGEQYLFQDGYWNVVKTFEVENNLDATVWEVYDVVANEHWNYKSPYQYTCPNWMYDDGGSFK